eukprot:317066-Chlamydomonas_euryale.AAC.6
MTKLCRKRERERKGKPMREVYLNPERLQRPEGGNGRPRRKKGQVQTTNACGDVHYAQKENCSSTAPVSSLVCKAAALESSIAITTRTQWSMAQAA